MFGSAAFQDGCMCWLLVLHWEFLAGLLSWLDLEPGERIMPGTGFWGPLQWAAGRPVFIFHPEAWTRLQLPFLELERGYLTILTLAEQKGQWFLSRRNTIFEHCFTIYCCTQLVSTLGKRPAILYSHRKQMCGDLTVFWVCTIDHSPHMEFLEPFPHSVDHDMTQEGNNAQPKSINTCL